MELSKHYEAAHAETHWYKHWETRGYFRSTPDEREPFTIVIPPPNVTGVLHMGHLLNNTVQDILIRRARQEGKNALWVPGTDHASIATEAKVVKMLRERGIKKSDLTRDEFLAYAWEWKEEYGGIILEQLKRLGASCDWERTRFTLEPKLSAAVIKVFVDLYKKGKIYRGLRMINWDPEAKTVLSGEEVILGEENSQLYHIRYRVEGTDEWIVIATQRPETIMADTALAVHPDDERYAHFKGKNVIVPLVNRVVPIIFDDYVDMAFGTGALKITPAHDPNDYALGEKYGLPVIDSLNEDGTLNEACELPEFIGLDRFEARKRMKRTLEASGNLVSIEPYRTSIPRSERTNAVVEPRLSLQWFVDMKALAAPALKAVMTDEVQFLPEQFKNMYRAWMNEDSIRDWCISRQLWWGQRVPAWYVAPSEGNELQTDLFFVAETEKEAYADYHAHCEKLGVAPSKLIQDEDALDTWFSSWLWPISVFDGFEDQTELNYYYPTSVLVTGFDIIFFWVARMIMAGYEYAPELLPNRPKYPFKQVYFTGLVRDRLRRKMSKSIGNSPDSLVLLDKYGADGVRFGMLYSAAAGNDIVFDAPFLDATNTKVANESALCEQGRNFCNKLWNALRLIHGAAPEHGQNGTASASEIVAHRWLDMKLSQTIIELESLLASFRLSEALKLLYNFIWDDFCSWYLEMIKPAYGEKMAAATYESAIANFEQIMVLLHPFMPFITEEIWHNLRTRNDGNDCAKQTVPMPQAIDNQFIKRIDTAFDIIQKVRELRNKNGISPKESIPLFVERNQKSEALLALDGWKAIILKLGNISELTLTDTEPANSVSFIGGTESYFAILTIEIDPASEKIRIEKELGYLRGFVASVGKKLENERFIANAKPEIIANERNKQADGEAKIAILEKELTKLSL